MSLINHIQNFIERKVSKKPSIPPADFFSQIKNNSQEINSEMILSIKKSLSQEIQQFIENGQLLSAERLLFHLACADKEQQVIKAGITRFVYRDDLDDFMTNVSNQVVKIIELENFERKIPNDKSKEINRVKELFDQVYIVFTDYTGREEKKIEKRERANDPIAFGTFHTKDNLIWNHRFYFICDWEDDYCDLTLDKYVAQMIAAGHDTPVHEAVPITVEELKNRLEEARKAKGVPDVNKDSILYPVAEWFGERNNES